MNKGSRLIGLLARAQELIESTKLGGRKPRRVRSGVIPTMNGTISQPIIQRIAALTALRPSGAALETQIASETTRNAVEMIAA